MNKIATSRRVQNKTRNLRAIRNIRLTYGILLSHRDLPTTVTSTIAFHCAKLGKARGAGLKVKTTMGCTALGIVAGFLVRDNFGDIARCW